VRFTKFCARSFDYDPDDATWWLSKSFGIEDGRVKDNDIGYIQIDGLADFCAVDEAKYSEGAKVGRTPSPIKLKKLMQDDLIGELKRVQANLKDMPQDRILVELATIKKRASRSPKMAELILPIMKDIHAQLAGGEGATGGSRNKRSKLSAKKKSQRIMAVVFGCVAVLVGVAVLLFSGSSEAKATEAKKQAEKKDQ